LPLDDDHARCLDSCDASRASPADGTAQHRICSHWPWLLDRWPPAPDVLLCWPRPCHAVIFVQLVNPSQATQQAFLVQTGFAPPPTALEQRARALATIAALRPWQPARPSQCWAPGPQQMLVLAVRRGITQAVTAPQVGALQQCRHRHWQGSVRAGIHVLRKLLKRKLCHSRWWPVALHAIVFAATLASNPNC
jgi:hypothetical protein